jgi:hypothetical protein
LKNNLNKFLILNQRGFLPLDHEDLTLFLKRVDTLEELPSSEAKVPFSLENPVKWHEWDWAKSTLKELFDVSPDWVRGYYSKEKLAPWHGAMTWVFNESKDFTYLIQLRPSLKKKKYLKIYDKDEILTHEAVHAVRAGLNSSKFEEFFAYWTATSLFRKVFGPLFQSPKESNIFMLLLSLLFLGQLLQNPFLSLSSFLLPVGYVSFLLFRLFLRRKKINKVLLKISSLTASKNKARAILFRLTDFEIENFSRWSHKKISSFISEEAKKNLRWEVINLAYFN